MKRSFLLLAVAFAVACQQPIGPGQIHAQDVILSNGGNNLQSSNLQQALDSEMRVDLAKLLPGTTWTITNKDSDELYMNTTGRVSFTSTAMKLEAGRFAVFGQVHTNENTYCNAHSDIEYELISDSVIFGSSATQASRPVRVSRSISLG